MLILIKDALDGKTTKVISWVHLQVGDRCRRIWMFSQKMVGIFDIP